jgi:uncharacterized protein YjbI with pentapeptide repeats
MSELFGIAEKIETPLSLAALAFLILYSVYRLIFSRLRLEDVVGAQVARLVALGMKLVFVLAIMALMLGILSYVFVHYIDAWLIERRTARLDTFLTDLNGNSSAVRLVAIQALVPLAGISVSADGGICGGFSALVRRQTAPDLSPAPQAKEPDVQAAIVALSTLRKGRHCGTIDLSHSDLRGLSLPDGTLVGARMTAALLDEANLAGVDLSDASLIGAQLTDTILRGATLKGARFNDALMSRTDLRDADLTGARGLADADLLTAKMAGAILVNVDLRRSRLPTENSVRGVSWKGADLRQTDLRSLKDICRKDLESAVIDSTTKLPDPFRC